MQTQLVAAIFCVNTNTVRPWLAGGGLNADPVPIVDWVLLGSASGESNKGYNYGSLKVLSVIVFRMYVQYTLPFGRKFGVIMIIIVHLLHLHVHCYAYAYLKLSS